MRNKTFLLFLLLPALVPAISLPGFNSDTMPSEQTVTFQRQPDIRIQINAPANFDPAKPTGIALFALPNGNTIEQTVGKVLTTGNDWHYNIQHIGAQTRFVRQLEMEYNLITVYLEARQLSWPTWKAANINYAELIKKTVEYLVSYFSEYDPFVILTGHSGGGRFIFSFLDAYDSIPAYVKRICFLDSNYGYEHSYGDKMITWLQASTDNFVSVLAYNDSVALYNGQPIVSATGGTWYRSRIMQKYLAQTLNFTSEENDEFIRHTALDGRIKFLLKKNPTQAILHTVQVERNGFIHTMLTGTALEDSNYTYYGDRCYSDLIQTDILMPPNVQIPLRDPAALTGSEFMDSVKDLDFNAREAAILNEFLTGNLPYFMRDLVQLEYTANDVNGTSHQIQYRVMPFYLAVGSDSNYCRVPMGPITAQKIADFYGTCLPTRKLVNNIYVNTAVKLAPVTYYPVGNENEQVEKFILHNTAIEEQFATAGGSLGQLTGGTKKDVVLSNKITDGYVVIYGWHQLNGAPIQPLYSGHYNYYVDYSHGIRFIDSQISIDGNPAEVATVLKNALNYTLLSDESGIMNQPTYITDENLPGQPKSFGVKSEDGYGLRIVIATDTAVDSYELYWGSDGINFTKYCTFQGSEYLLENLPPDTLVYVKLIAENTAGFSSESEVLAGLPVASTQPEVLVVNGFDRSSTGNTYNFIRQHARAFQANTTCFNAATNDAVLAGLFHLSDYEITDYILGEESTVDETFSSSEQTLVAKYLKAGGKLFVSGAEIAWDLDYKGSSTDKSFFYNYLKAKYSADAPGGVSGTYYSAEGIAAGIFSNLTSITYDNGTQGTFNVKYPDALIAANGSKNEIKYKNVTTHSVGGISFDGYFPNGTAPGKLVYLGFPFETVYPAATRNTIMEDVLTFFHAEYVSTDQDYKILPTEYSLGQNYPNPFNPTTTINYTLPEVADVQITVYNILGEVVNEWSLSNLSAGFHHITWNGIDQYGSAVSSGAYFYRLSSDNFNQTRKMVLIK